MAPPEPDDDALLGFLRERDVPCPLCGYNLRNLTRPLCPECRQPLSLSVGVTNLRLGLFVTTIAPSIFSGIAALFLAVPVIASLFVPSMGLPPPFIAIVNAFGLLSGIAGLVLLILRQRFLALPRGRQAVFAAMTWLIHVAMTAYLLWSIFS